MKETTGSLRAYFLVIGAIVLVQYGQDAAALALDVPFWIAVVHLPVGLAYIGLGLFTTRLLRTAPEAFYYVLAINAVSITVLTAITAVLFKVVFPGMIGLALTWLITIYLVRSVRRLSTEVRSGVRA